MDGYLPPAGHKFQRMPLHGGVQPVVLDAELRHRHLDFLLERAELLHTQAATGVRGAGGERGVRDDGWGKLTKLAASKLQACSGYCCASATKVLQSVIIWAVAATRIHRVDSLVFS